MKTLLLSLLISAAVLLAQQPGPAGRRTPPPPKSGKPMEPVPANGKPKPFAVPPRDTLRLPNGLQASLVQYGTAPLVSISVVVQAGNLNEAPDQDALADLLAALMKEGAKGKSARQMAEEAAAMGGSLNVNAGADQTFAGISVLGEFAPQALQMLADVVQSPDLPASELERLRRDMIRNATMAKARPAMLAEEALAKTLYPADHPYSRGVIPDEATLKRFTLDDVKKFHASQFGAARTRIYVVGRFDKAQVKSTIEKAFGGWRKGPDPVRNPPKMTAKKQVVFVDRPNSEQAVVRFAVPVPVEPGDKDAIPLEVLDNLLGGSFISRITQNIREEKGYTYSPFSSIRTNYKAAAWVHSSELQNKFAAPGVKEILKEINKVRAEAPPVDELERIKNDTAGTFVLRNASNGGVMGQLQFVDSHGLTDDYLRTYVDKVRAVTREDIQRLAETYLNPSKMAVIVVGEKTKVQEAVDALQ
jgi:zinc protease